jgi:hypothetical protein
MSIGQPLRPANASEDEKKAVFEFIEKIDRGQDATMSCPRCGSPVKHHVTPSGFRVWCGEPPHFEVTLRGL